MRSVAVVALDIHKKFSKAVALAGSSEVVGDWRIAHGDPGEMAAFLAGFDPGTEVVMEATFNWPWIAEVAQEVGLSPHLAHPVRAREMARGMAKSDKKDAVFLGRLWLAGEIFPEAYLAPAKVRRMRALFRQRLLLVRMRVAVKNSVHGQLFRLGVVTDGQVSDLFSAKGRGVLATLELERGERWLLQEKLATIEELSGRIGVLEKALKKRLAEDPRAAILMSLPGVGELTAYAMLAEIGEVERFANGRALASYAGLLPLDRESAEKDFGKRTSRSCNHFLRWTMIEAVTGAVRKSPRMRSLHARVKARNRQTPGKARVAVARELLELAHLLLSRGHLYQERRPLRPGVLRGGRFSQASDPNRASQVSLCARPPHADQAAM